MRIHKRKAKKERAKKKLLVFGPSHVVSQQLHQEASEPAWSLGRARRRILFAMRSGGRLTTRGAFVLVLLLMSL